MTDHEPINKLAKLAVLRADFAAALPDRVTALAAWWETAKAANNQGDALAELTRLAHSIAGSAGSFGYRRLGEVARELEQTLAQLAKASDSLFSAEQSRISELIGIMARLALKEAEERLDMSDSISRIGTENADTPDNRRVVLIEDDAQTAEDLAAKLGAFGWKVSIFNNTRDAYSALDYSEPPAAVIDIMLPEGPLAGLELIRQIQSNRNITVPHVVLSNRNDWEARLAAVRSGAAAYLVKPIDISALEEQLDRIVDSDLPEPYRVLLVDDDEILAGHYALTLSAAGMDTYAISSPSGLLGAITEFQPEIILMDLYMPECTGVEALKVIRQDAQFDSLPVVFLSAESSLAIQQDAMKIGAEDFLQKPISDTNLVLAVSIRVERFRALNKLIRQDSLTGLLNHIAFKLRLEAEVDRCRRANEPIAVVMLDIDHFKQVNDTYGHPQGDRVIKSIALLLRKRLRKSDIIGRYGGEEFVIAMPNTLPALAVSIMDGLRESFGKLRFEAPQGEFGCTFSCGVSGAPPLESPITLIKSADQALYQAKNSGRNRIELFKDAGMDIS
ncbi:MAG: diguanylate cyclase [Methylobacter sp.]|nr:MAG: diguanylate cyclase [Methylobacter sp.]